MKKKIWTFIVKKSKPHKGSRNTKASFFATSKHGNGNNIFTMRGYNQKQSLLKEIYQIFPKGSVKIIDLTKTK